MNIALITNDIPFPPHKNGGANSISHLFKEAKELNIDLIFVGDSDTELKVYEKQLLEVFNKLIFIRLPKKKTVQLQLRAITTFHTIRSLRIFDLQINNYIDKYDALFIHDFPMIKYCSIKHKNKVFFICDSQIKLMDSYIEVEKNTFKKLYLRYKKKVYSSMIKRYHKDFGKILYISEVDMEYDKKEFPFINNMYFINNGVDCDYFKPEKTNKYSYDLVFVGNLEYKPNLEAASFIISDIIPSLISDYPTIKCAIVGKNPPSHFLNKVKNNKNVEVTGFVEDVRPYLNESKIFISPLFSGAGMKNKILEAMAMNKIIIGTNTSYEGINIDLNGNYFVNSEDHHNFGKFIKKALSNFKVEKELITNRDKVNKYYSWSSQSEKLIKIIKR